MTDKRRRWWESMRARGFWRFVLGDGVVRFGASFALILLLWDEWLDPTELARPHPITHMAFGGLLAGLAYGFGTWWTMERWYHRATPPEALAGDLRSA